MNEYVYHHHHLGESGFDHVDALMWAIIAAALVIEFLL